MKKQLSMQNINRWVVFFGIILITSTVNVTLNRIVCIAFIGCSGITYLTKGRYDLRMNNHLVWYGLYILFFVFSSVYAISPASKVNSMMLSCVMTFLLGYCFLDNINSKDDIRFYLMAFMMSSMMSVFNMVSHYGSDIVRQLLRGELTLRIGDDVSNSNSVGMSLARGALIAVFFLRDDYKGKRSAAEKAIYILIIVINTAFAMLSGSRKALVLLFCGYAILFTFCGNRGNITKRVKTILISLGVLVLFFVALKNIPAFAMINRRMDKLLRGLFSDAALDHSSVTRFRFINEGWGAFISHPILGQGPYASYMYFGTYAHNNFIEVLMNTGIIGFIIFYLPYMKTCMEFYYSSKTDDMYWMMLTLFLWTFVGGIGMVTYYSKMSIFILVMVSEWLKLNRYEQSLWNALI